MDSNSSTSRTPLRVWPGVIAVTLQWLAWLILPALLPEWAGAGILATAFLGLVIVIWWLFFSRATWSERLGAIVLIVATVAATSRFVHDSIANGMMGMMLFIYAIPTLSLALVAWAVASRGLSSGVRRASLVACIVLACGALTLIRTGGISGGGDSDIHWRWTPTAEQRLLAQSSGDLLDAARGRSPARPPAPAAATPPETTVEASDTGAVPTSAPTVPEAAKKSVSVEAGANPSIPPDSVIAKPVAEWPGFRGPARNGVVRNVRVETDWSTKPPVELWRRAVGPGWSSFAVDGDLVYTQEQRAEHELVSCYRLDSGEPVWRHRDAVRFWESNAGAGPRGTPTVHNGRVYTLGATGTLNALDAGSGARLWSRNAVTDTGKTIPPWGIASSPLVIGNLVIVAVAGQLAAYDLRTGDLRWVGEGGGGGYSSPHLATIGGVPQILLVRGSRTISVRPADGALLWDHSWEPAVAITQPALVGEHDVLIGLGEAMGMGGLGIRRLAVAHGPAGWKVEERWTSRGLKPYFNDFVVHEGHAFGFDGSILACINLEDGTRKWKGGRYGHGQVLLLPDQDVLLVLSEEGELALVSATPDKFTEFARVPAIEGKTWNHPVLVGDVLLVRNGEEMAAFRLSPARR